MKVQNLYEALRAAGGGGQVSLLLEPRHSKVKGVCFLSMLLLVVVGSSPLLPVVSSAPILPPLFLEDGVSFSEITSNTTYPWKPLEGDVLTATGFTLWPSGFACEGDCFMGSVQAGPNSTSGSGGPEHLWLLPMYQNQILRVHKESGLMTAFSTWPAWLATSNYSSQVNWGGAAYDSERQLIWLTPCQAGSPASVSVITGTINFCPTTWPDGFSLGAEGTTGSKFLGSFFQSSGSYLWMIPYEANMVVRMQAPCAVTTTYRQWSLKVTSVAHSKDCCNDGSGTCKISWLKNKPEPRYQVRAYLDGDTVPSMSVINLGTSVTCGTISRTVQLASSSSTNVESFKVDYLMWEEDGCGSDNQYNTDCTFVTDDDKVGSGTVSYPLATTASTFSISSDHGYKITFQLTQSEVTPVGTVSATTGYSSWPAGYVSGTHAFDGALFDGSDTAYLIPCDASQVVKMTLSTGSMNGYHAWPLGFVGNMSKFSRGTFTGEQVWLAARQANMIIKLATADGAMTGYNHWPTGVVLGINHFTAAAYDGKYAWFPPRDASHLIRIDASTGEMVGFNHWNSMDVGGTTTTQQFLTGTSSALLDVWTNDLTSLWLVPTGTFQINTTRLTRLMFQTTSLSESLTASDGSLTLTGSETLSEDSYTLTTTGISTPSTEEPPSMTFTATGTESQTGESVTLETTRSGNETSATRSAMVSLSATLSKKNVPPPTSVPVVVPASSTAQPSPVPSTTSSVPLSTPAPQTTHIHPTTSPVPTTEAPSVTPAETPPASTTSPQSTTLSPKYNATVAPNSTALSKGNEAAEDQESRQTTGATTTVAVLAIFIIGGMVFLAIIIAITICCVKRSNRRRKHRALQDGMEDPPMPGRSGEVGHADFSNINNVVGQLNSDEMDDIMSGRVGDREDTDDGGPSVYAPAPRSAWGGVTPEPVLGAIVVVSGDKKSEILCSRCHNSPATFVAFPCGHLVSCADCVSVSVKQPCVVCDVMTVKMEKKRQAVDITRLPAGFQAPDAVKEAAPLPTMDEEEEEDCSSPDRLLSRSESAPSGSGGRRTATGGSSGGGGQEERVLQGSEIELVDEGTDFGGRPRRGGALREEADVDEDDIQLDMSL